MKHASITKTVSSTLLVGFLLQPFFFLAPNQAQAISFGAATSSVAAAAIGCGVQKLLQRPSGAEFSGQTIGSEIEQKTGVSLSVQVHDQAVSKSSAAVANKLTCEQRVARAAVQVVLRELTKETVNWINTGFNGQPLYIRNPGSFFKSIADQEIGGLATVFSDRNKYPFGQSFIRGYIQQTQNTLERNAQYSLANDLGGYTPQQFNNNFNNGGWNGWLSLTQKTGNNPISFGLVTTAELDARLAGTKQSKAQDARDELNQGNGFLSQKVCVDPIGYVPPAGTFANITDLESSGVDPSTVTDAGGTIDMCRRYETTTPGGIVASQLTSALDSGRQNLIIAPADLDASLQAVFDALANQLFKKGLASLSDAANGGNSSSNSNTSITSTGGYGSNVSAVTTTNTNTNTNNQWFNQNPQFDITHPADIDHIITTQNDYIKAIIDDPAIAAPVLDPHGFYPLAPVLGTNQKGQNYWLSKIIPEIYQLDYCIPGPHPGWESDAQIRLQQNEAKIKDVSLLSGTTLGGVADTLTLGLGTTLVNLFDNLGTAGNMNADDHRRAKIYSGELVKQTGIIALIHDDHDNTKTVMSRDKLTSVLDALFERFVNEMNNVRFSNANLPGVAGEGVTFFNNVSGYQSILNDNNRDIITLQGAVRRLTEFRDQVTSLNAQLASNAITQADYDNKIDFIRRSFAALTPNLVNENSIQTIRSQIQETISDLVYIHNNLLKGPNGCEADFANVPWQSQVRAPYPQPHLYDYPDTHPHTGTGNPYYTFLRSTVFGTDTNFSNQLFPGDDVIYITDLIDFYNVTYYDTVPIFESNLGPIW